MKNKEFIITSAMITVIIYTLSLSLVTQTFPQNQQSAIFSSSGTIQIQTSLGIGVYSDYQCEYELNTVSWGTLQPGDTKEIVCFVQNEGNSLLVLSLETDNWNPSIAANYLTLDWDYDAQQISVDSIVQITLTLSVAQNIEGIDSFGFDIIIVGSG